MDLPGIVHDMMANVRRLLLPAFLVALALCLGLRDAPRDRTTSLHPAGSQSGQVPQDDESRAASVVAAPRLGQHSAHDLLPAATPVDAAERLEFPGTAGISRPVSFPPHRRIYPLLI